MIATCPGMPEDPNIDRLALAFGLFTRLLVKATNSFSHNTKAVYASQLVLLSDKNAYAVVITTPVYHHDTIQNSVTPAR